MSLGVAIDVGIGLILMYLLLSLLVTALNELVAQFGSIRARHLESALKHMLDLRLSDGDAANLKLFEEIRNSPTFQIAGEIATTEGTGAAARPSYISAKTFLALLREAIPKLNLQDKDGNVLDLKTTGDLNALIDALPNNSGLKTALTAVVGDMSAAAQDVEKRIGAWFDGMMERATGAYKRWMATFSLLFGLALAVGFNCDTLRVADGLAKSPELRAAVAQLAESVNKRCTGADGKPVLAEPACSDARKNLAALQALPIGWQHEIGWLSIIGWLITGLAVSLG
ncbi:MAG TPA: hypothetical protein VJ890_24355, partial [Vineibacter sp.]|nr:hypothetical protein [Vineibacter sp.]